MWWWWNVFYRLKTWVFGVLNFPLITCAFIGTKIGIGMRMVYDLPWDRPPLSLHRSANDNSSPSPVHVRPCIIAYICCCRRWFSNRPDAELSGFGFLFSFHIFTFFFFNQISVSCCSFSFLFLSFGNQPKFLGLTHYILYIYTHKYDEPSFYLLKSFIKIFFSLFLFSKLL